MIELVIRIPEKYYNAIKAITRQKVRKNMTTCEITAEMNIENIIAESREIAQAWNGLVEELERIEKKYAEPQDMSEQERWLKGV